MSGEVHISQIIALIYGIMVQRIWNLIKYYRNGRGLE